MDKRKIKKKGDLNVRAFNIAQEAVDESPPKNTPEESPPKNPHAVALGRLGGKKGGVARAKKLTKEQRRKIAQKAAQARWRKAEKQ
jgi:hypothetical protein